MRRIPLPVVNDGASPPFDYAEVLEHVLLTAPAGKPLPTAQMMARFAIALKVRARAGTDVVLETAEYAVVKAALEAFAWVRFGDACAHFVNAIEGAAHFDPNATADSRSDQP